MKILKWLVILLIYVLVFLTIKNIQIILPILFEYKEIIEIIVSYSFAVIAIILQCLMKCDNATDDNE